MTTLVKTFPDDYLSDVELIDYRSIRGPVLMTNAARVQIQEKTSKNIDQVHEVLKGLPFEDVLTAVAAHIEARPDVSTKHLEVFGNLCSRHAWEIERGNN